MMLGTGMIACQIRIVVKSTLKCLSSVECCAMIFVTVETAKRSEFPNFVCSRMCLPHTILFSFPSYLQLHSSIVQLHNLRLKINRKQMQPDKTIEVCKINSLHLFILESFSFFFGMNIFVPFNVSNDNSCYDFACCVSRVDFPK